MAAVAGWMTQSDWDEAIAADNFESGGEDRPDAYSPISREETSGCEDRATGDGCYRHLMVP